MKSTSSLFYASLTIAAGLTVAACQNQSRTEALGAHAETRNAQDPASPATTANTAQAFAPAAAQPAMQPEAQPMYPPPGQAAAPGGAHAECPSRAAARAAAASANPTARGAWNSAPSPGGGDTEPAGDPSNPTNVQLGSGPTTVQVPVQRAGSSASSGGVRLSAGQTRVSVGRPAPAPGQRVYLALWDCTVSAPPGVVYQVYLGQVDQAHYVGPLSLYGAEQHPITVRLGDVTTVAQRVDAEGGPWDVLIVAQDAPAPGSDVVIGRVTLTSQ
jgi:hypothetical protein